MEQAKESKTGEREQQQLQQQGVRREVNKPDECAVCVSTFDEIERRPRTLPCGYSFCTCCVVGLMTEGQLLCPSCGVKHPAPSVDHFPISHGIEALIKNLRSRVLTQGSLSQEYVDPAAKARPTALGPHERCEAAISERQQVLLQEKKTHFSFLIQQYQDMKAQLEQYHTQLAGWRDQHHQLEEALFLLAKKNKEAKDFVEQEISKAIAAKEQGDDGEQKVAAMQGRFDIPSTAGEADEVMDTAYRCAGVAETWKWKCWKTFPNPTIVTNSLKILEMTEVVADAAGRVLETAGAEAGATTAPKPQGGTASTIQDRVQALVPVKVQDLKNMKESMRRLVEAGQVMAVHEDEGRRRSSKITVRDGRVYVHALQDQPPPPSAAILQMSELVPAAPPCLVFLDVAWPDSPPQRVYIRLNPDTPMGRQFLLLCTGLQGPSYRGSNLYKVGTSPGGWVEGGYYENDGKGSTALLPNLGRGDYRMCGQEGIVWGWPEAGARFAILIRLGGVFGGVFGRVEGGLHVLKAAAKHEPITAVTLVDCGVVLWQ